MDTEQKPKTLIDFPQVFDTYYGEPYDIWAQCNYSCPTGWENIVYNLTKDLLQIWPDMHVMQVKQKFGGLRYYFNTEPPDDLRQRVYKKVDEAEKQARNACEKCGRAGLPTYIGSWLLVLCSKCKEEAREREGEGNG